MPVIAPVFAFKVQPSGSLPDTTFELTGAMPPFDWNCAAYAVPTLPVPYRHNTPPATIATPSLKHDCDRSRQTRRFDPTATTSPHATLSQQTMTRLPAPEKNKRIGSHIRASASSWHRRQPFQHRAPIHSTLAAGAMLVRVVLPIDDNGCPASGSNSNPASATAASVTNAETLYAKPTSDASRNGPTPTTILTQRQHEIGRPETTG